MLGRQVGSLLLRLPINARLVLRSAQFQCQHGFTSRLLASSAQRSFATPGRPRKAVGEPSRPVKRATKRAARSSSTGEAGRQVREKKKGTSTRKTTAKKATGKKTTSKKRVRKPLTDEQKAVREARISRAKITELKKQALSPPKEGSHITAHGMLVREKTKGMKLSGSNRTEAFGQVAKDASRDYKQLTPAELEVSHFVLLQDYLHKFSR